STGTCSCFVTALGVGACVHQACSTVRVGADAFGAGEPMLRNAFCRTPAGGREVLTAIVGPACHLLGRRAEVGVRFAKPIIERQAVHETRILGAPQDFFGDARRTAPTIIPTELLVAAIDADV